MVFDLAGDGLVMTSPEAGVWFDLDGDGKAEQISWTARDSDDAILVLDVNGNGEIDGGKEVIGRQFRLKAPWAATSGADALAHELQGLTRGQSNPSGAGEIDRNDPIFRRLLLWTDRNHDGRSTSSELSSLEAAHVALIYAGFLRPNAGTPRSLDNVGNRRLFEGTFHIQARGLEFERRLVEYEPRRQP